MNDELIERVAEAMHDATLGKEKVLKRGKLNDVAFVDSPFYDTYQGYARAAIAAIEGAGLLMVNGDDMRLLLDVMSDRATVYPQEDAARAICRLRVIAGKP